jgi:hypothetical protein
VVRCTGCAPVSARALDDRRGSAGILNTIRLRRDMSSSAMIKLTFLNLVLKVPAGTLAATCSPLTPRTANPPAQSSCR